MNIQRRIPLRLIAGLPLLSFASLILFSFSPRIPWPSLWPKEFSGEAWSKLLLSSDLGASLLESVAIGLICVSICLLCCLPAAHTLGLKKIPYSNVWLTVLITPALVTGFGPGIGIAETLSHLDLTGSRWGTALGHSVAAYPYLLLVLATKWRSQGESLEEQAQSLGESPVKVWLRITLPQLGPAIGTGSLLVFVSSFGDYLLTSLISEGSIETLPLALYPLIESGDRPAAAAASLVLILPVIWIAWLSSRTQRRRAKR